jgi:hypothetical protein
MQGSLKTGIFALGICFSGRGVVPVQTPSFDVTAATES